MTYLLDTSVISELRKGARCSPRVRRWWDGVDDDKLFISVLVIGEIRRGVELLRRRDPSAAARLDQWVRSTERQFADRVLPITIEICDLWGRIGLDRPLAAIDGLLAATALHHRLTLVTRNTADVARSGADMLNPFESQSVDR